ncbi:hypothetical protein [Bacillus sp. KH172YL63]|uniref:hypothetical protein n=1 Tax=Bacillus sp. KH172YL63 TaxID=2709784 RepID=UPI0013E446A8|nr:hypothetical protein [Bacillus sp. KH172YL63]BCB04462.1 hypothetical protein KH172YL63_25950 [Bacillus sp. KH172YL63]
MIHKLLKKVFRKWDLVYSTQDVGEYATMKGRLMQNGVEHKTKTISSGGGEGGGYGYASTYQLYVPKEDAHKANKAIHHSK